MYLLHGVVKPTKKGTVEVKSKPGEASNNTDIPPSNGPSSNMKSRTKNRAGRKAATVTGNTGEKYGIEDSLESMLKFRTNISATAPKKKIEQPYILCIGDDIYHVKEFYVVMEETTYSATSFLHAIEIAFKIFNLFNFQYPVPSYNVWLFIQKYFFDLHFSEYDEPSTEVTSLITKLGCFEEELASRE